MRVMFIVSAYGPEASEASRLKKDLETLMKRYNLDGETRGVENEQFANFSGSYHSGKKDDDKYDGKDKDKDGWKEKGREEETGSTEQ